MFEAIGAVVNWCTGVLFSTLFVIYAYSVIVHKIKKKREAKKYKRRDF